MASGAKDTRRLASDFLRASRRAVISFSISSFSFSSRSLAAACCSSSVRSVTLVSLTAALPSTWNGFGRISAPLTIGLDEVPISKSVNEFELLVDAGTVFLGLPFRAETWAGISRSGGIVGLSMDFGGG